MNDPSDRLRQARTAAGFASIQDAVDRFGWTYSTYGGHENGSRGIRADAAKSYARAYGVEESWLLFGSGKGPGGTVSAQVEREQPRMTQGFSEPEALPFAPRHKSEKARVHQVAQILSPDLTPSYFVAGSDRPDLSLLTGDLLILDPRPRPKLGDIVIGTVVDMETGNSTTFLRRYFAPHLVGSSARNEDHLRTDDERTSIMGVVISSLRNRA